MLSDLERLQKEIDARRQTGQQPHVRSAAAKDSPADSVISMPNEAHMSTKKPQLAVASATMLTPRGVELEMDEDGGET